MSDTIQTTETPETIARDVEVGQPDVVARIVASTAEAKTRGVLELRIDGGGE